MTKILSFDVGIVNLAYTIVENKGKDFYINNWGIFNISTEPPKEDIEYHEVSCQKDNIKCDKALENTRDGKVYCKKHSPIGSENLVCCKTTASGTKCKGKVKCVDNNHNFICKKHYEQSLKQSGCEFIKKKGDKCDKKTMWYDSVLNKSYCTAHSKGTNNELTKIKKKKATSLDLFLLGTNLINTLDKYPEILEVDYVLIENQPFNKNPRMKTIQMIIYSYFLMKHLYNPESQLIKIVNFLPKNKLDCYDGPPIVINEKNAYTKRKKLSIEYTKYYLKKDKKSLEILESHKKKDDMADCFIQALTYFKNNLKV